MSSVPPPESVLPITTPVSGTLDGHLTRAQLENVLAEVGRHIEARGMASVLLDCTAMDGYDLETRHAFVDWNKTWRAQISRVAIVTNNRLYHVVIGAMSLASGQPMKGFAERDDAEAWLRGLDR